MGPLAFRPARRVEGNAPLVATLLQMLAFWTLVLVVLPMIWLERHSARVRCWVPRLR